IHLAWKGRARTAPWGATKRSPRRCRCSDYASPQSQFASPPRVILARLLRLIIIIINRCTSLYNLSAIATPLCLPRAFAQSTGALAAPNATAGSRAQAARTVGPRPARLHHHPHGAGRRNASLHGDRRVAGVADNSVTDGDRIAQRRRAGSVTSHDGDAPFTVKTAAGKAGIGRPQAGQRPGQRQGTGWDKETEPSPVRVGICGGMTGRSNEVNSAGIV